MKIVRMAIAVLITAILCCAASCVPGINDPQDSYGDDEGTTTIGNSGHSAALQSSIVAFTSDWYDGNQITSRYNPKQKQKTKQKQKEKQKQKSPGLS